MTFGQQSGPPASAKQVQELLALLQGAGHSGFRDARGPLGFTQRQANGKFTRDEAATFIDSFEGPGPEQAAMAAPRVPPPPSASAGVLRRMPDEHLAAELRRRGWTVLEP